MKLVILDRDGTIGDMSGAQSDLSSEWQPLPGALQAIARLNHGGWHVVIASNEGGLGRGVYEMTKLNDLQARMYKMLAVSGARIEAMFFCPHAPDEACGCRKPGPGLFVQIGERYGIDLKGTPVVGDSLDDAIAAAAAGCDPHLVLTGEGAQYRGSPLPDTFPPGVMVHEDLAAFVKYLGARDDLVVAAGTP
ncbi:MAG: D-glycero-beta-D-manno-heptose 1,7-bisphosphate 7-phosphatase [Burkholderiaceae bacterium]